MIDENEQLGTRWASAFASGDLAGLAAMSGSGMRIWHSHDDRWMSREEGGPDGGDVWPAQATCGRGAYQPDRDRFL